MLLLFATGLSVALAGCAGNGGGGDDGGAAPSASEQALIDQGVGLHKAIMPAVLNEDVNVRRYVQQVGQRITEAAKEMRTAATRSPSASRSLGGEWVFGGQMRFQLLDCDIANAFTAGGRHVYVYNGLLQRCQSEEELAAAIAHVYAHLYGGHHNGRTALPEDARPEDVIVTLINDRHSPQEEQEADVVGFQLFARAGWDPLAYGNLAQRLQDTRRADAARAMAEQLPPAALDWARPPIADAKRFAEYQKTALNLGRGELEGDIRLLLTAVPSCLTAVDQPDQLAAQQQLLNPPVPLETPAPFEKGPRARPR
jgi:hypothetical protein